MKTFLLMFVLLPTTVLISCGAEPCSYFDFKTDGICVTHNGFEVNKDYVSFSVGMLQKSFKTFGYSFDLEAELESLGGIDARFLTEADEAFLPDSNSEEGYWGRAYPWENLIVMNAQESAALSKSCYVKYYALGHELMHMIAELLMGVSNDDDVDHNVSYLFKRWAKDHDKDQGNTVEGVYEKEIKVLCMYHQP
jgi:hypothetical protein